LPAPFSTGSDIANENNNFQVTYRIPPDSPMGYIETIVSPWNSNNVVLAILGNTTQGVSWAASALIDPLLRSRLAGNFVVVNNQQVLTSNTRVGPVIAGVANPTQQAVSNVTQPQSTPSNQIESARPAWILPVFASSLILILLVIFIVVIRGRSRSNLRKSVVEDQKLPKSDDDHSDNDN